MNNQDYLTQPVYLPGDPETLGTTNDLSSLISNSFDSSGMESTMDRSNGVVEITAGGPPEVTVGPGPAPAEPEEEEQDSIIVRILQRINPFKELTCAISDWIRPEEAGQNAYLQSLTETSRGIDTKTLTEQPGTFSFGRIDDPQDKWLMRNPKWETEKLGGGYNFGEAGCKASAGAMISSTMTGNERADPLAMQRGSFIDSEGNISYSDIETAIEYFDPKGRDVMSDYWEKKLDRDKILEIADENTFVIGRASLGGIGDEHWIVLEGGKVTEDDIIFDYSGTSKNDLKEPARTYTLNTEDESKKIYRINRIETFVFSTTKEE